MIGSEEFVEEVTRKHVRGKKNERGEESRLRELAGVKPDAVIGEVAQHFGIGVDEIGTREQRYTDARYVASYLLRGCCLMTLQEIGAVVGLHYSAVGNAIRQVRERPTKIQAKSRALESRFKNQ